MKLKLIERGKDDLIFKFGNWYYRILLKLNDEIFEIDSVIRYTSDWKPYGAFEKFEDFCKWIDRNPKKLRKRIEKIIGKTSVETIEEYIQKLL